MATFSLFGNRTRVTVKGDEVKARDYMGEVNRLLYQLREQAGFRNLSHYVLERRFEDGSWMRATTVHGQENVTVFVPMNGGEKGKRKITIGKKMLYFYTTAGTPTNYNRLYRIPLDNPPEITADLQGPYCVSGWEGNEPGYPYYGGIRMAAHPSGLLVIGDSFWPEDGYTFSAVRVSYDFGTTWKYTHTFTTTPYHEFQNIDVHIDNAGNIWVVVESDTLSSTDVYRSTDKGKTFELYKRVASSDAGVLSGSFTSSTTIAAYVEREATHYAFSAYYRSDTNGNFYIDGKQSKWGFDAPNHNPYTPEGGYNANATGFVFAGEDQPAFAVAGDTTVCACSSESIDVASTIPFFAVEGRPVNPYVYETGWRANCPYDGTEVSETRQPDGTGGWVYKWIVTNGTIRDAAGNIVFQEETHLDPRINAYQYRPHETSSPLEWTTRGWESVIARNGSIVHRGGMSDGYWGWYSSELMRPYDISVDPKTKTWCAVAANLSSSGKAYGHGSSGPLGILMSFDDGKTWGVHSITSSNHSYGATIYDLSVQGVTISGDDVVVFQRENFYLSPGKGYIRIHHGKIDRKNKAFKSWRKIMDFTVPIEMPPDGKIGIWTMSGTDCQLIETTQEIEIEE